MIGKKLVVRSYKQLIALQVPKTKFLVEPSLLSQGGNMFIYGKQETLKSWIALDLAMSLSSGQLWLGLYKTEKSKVLVIQSEQTEIMYRERVIEYSRQFDGKLPDLDLSFCTDLTLSLDNAFGLAALESAIIEHKPKAVLFDNLYHLVPRLTSEDEVAKFLKGLDNLREKYGTAMVTVAHPRKKLAEEMQGSPDEDIENLFGSAKFLWWADTVIRTSWVNKDQDLLSLTFQKTKNAQYHVEGVNLQFHRNPVRLTLH